VTGWARLVLAAEETCGRSGCSEIELQVTRSFPEPEHLTQPCHCIVMRKELQ
jgi:hypothetical protein